MHWVDLGSGAGFPGLVVAIIAADRQAGGKVASARFTLIESDNKKCAFMREVLRKTGLGNFVTVDILCERIEYGANTSKLGTVDVISARALTALERLLDLSAPIFGSDTIALFLKGREAELEAEKAKGRWDFNFDLLPSITEANAAVVMVRSLRSKKL